MTRNLDIHGMHCDACVSKIEEALAAVPGVESVAVTLAPPRATVSSSGEIADSVFEAALKGAGAYSLRRQAAGASGAVGARADDASGSGKEAAAQGGPAATPAASKSILETYRPLLLLVAYLAGGAVLLRARGDGFSLWDLMSDFMGCFFVAFSFFKLLDLRGFASSYRSYDLVCRAWPPWAGYYPFVELSLGVLYLIGFFPVLTNVAALLLMSVSALGVVGILLKGTKVRCACLGVVFDLPMSVVTLVENLTMAGMALLMLFHLLGGGEPPPAS